jgi:hypothetical protein
MALSVDSTNSAAAVARVEQQTRQQNQIQQANQVRSDEEAARTRQAGQQAKEAQNPPTPVVNEKGQETGGTVNTTA